MAALPQQLDTTDEGLAHRVARGDDGAFAELYRRYAGPLAAFAARIIGDRSGGEDVAQTALLNAYQAMRRGQGPTSVRPWLYGIARNTSYDTIRARRDVVGAEIEAVHEDARDAGLDREALLAAVRDLPQRQRDVYLLRELNGLSVSEIAARLDLAVGQVEQSLFAARNRLAEHLVFGGRLTCADVQSLGPGSLGVTERRALKSHVRHCSTCRKSGVGRSAFGLANVLEGLRQLVQGLFAGGAALPAAAKVGAVAATAALAGGGAVVATKVAPSSTAVAAAATTGEFRPPFFSAADRTAAAALAAVVAPAFLRSAAAGSHVSWLLPATSGTTLQPAAPVSPVVRGAPVSSTDRTTADAAGGGDQGSAGRSSDANAVDATAADTATDASATDATPADASPTDSTPADTSPVDSAPADAAPADTTPADAAPADTTPADTAPADTTPADTTPVDEQAAPAP